MEHQCSSCIQANADDIMHPESEMHRESCDMCGNFCCRSCMKDTDPIKLPVIGQMSKTVCYSCRERIKEIETAFFHSRICRETLHDIIKIAAEFDLGTGSIMDAVSTISRMDGTATGILRYLGYPVDVNLEKKD